MRSGACGSGGGSSGATYGGCPCDCADATDGDDGGSSDGSDATGGGCCAVGCGSGAGDSTCDSFAGATDACAWSCDGSCGGRGSRDACAIRGGDRCAGDDAYRGLP